MIIYPNVPKEVRNWAYCERKIKSLSEQLEKLEQGVPRCYAEAMKLHYQRRKRLTPNETRADRQKVSGKLRHYTRLKKRIERFYPVKPQRFLHEKSYLMQLLKETLYVEPRELRKKNNKAALITMICLSENADMAISTMGEKFSCLDLLSMGFGKI